MPRHALIVGGTRGIGAAIAEALLDGGWRLTLASRQSRSPALEARGAGWLRADVSLAAEARALVDQTRPDALVLAAGDHHRARIPDETDAGWRAAFAQNLDPLFTLGQAALPHMQARGWGRILSFGIANAHRQQANPALPAYYIAKVGVVLLTRALAVEGAPFGVTANCISPGFIDAGSSLPGELARPQIPAGRPGLPADVVGAARLLLSDEAAYINGADLVISGGWGL